ncbi:MULTISPECIES: MFS transporter [Streptomyces]|uniref:L-Proline or Glycine betaine transporter ProP n=1 Tax=Streptomyces venezuelae (strain ATCC 10712 / CBS 650.69 / DSM 40230 / JCM 4526 / NBRC 13096 / PD 04745) TaxID=953739 RepID=F2R387_STRVP|nr:MFS transporter [Streptomyces venezuelae]APE19573.1 MFS transporter [Streptomyces venezuelae]QER96988.1 MFS transporter [Streptomyces venezuelae ATCC 10712]CCA53333.1 L-Proline or Glycine betaine transporter ProP [Streptomyces venezuelae ATCC 10712]
MTETDHRPSPKAPPATTARTFFISGFGTALEFYDFIIYGLAAAIVFPAVFFPSFDRTVGTLVAFAAFGSGFVARPLGGIVIGHFGDRIGRKAMLVLTLLIMGGSTFLIGCLPAYDTVGVAAPVMLVALRLVQGFAAGGEWGGASLFGIENAPEDRRGLWGSFTSAGIGIGSLFGTGAFTLVTLLPEEALQAWAWRVPFWLGGLLVLVGVVARSRMPHEERRTDRAPRVPILAAVKRHPRQMLLAIGVAFGYNTLAYIGTIFTVTYAEERGYTSTESLLLQVAGSVAFTIAVPAMAVLSDRRGRKPVVIIGTLAYAAFFFVYFPLVDGHVLVLATLAYVLVNVLMAAPQACIPAFLGEQFSAATRYSSISATYQTGAALGGGTAATAATALFIAYDNDPVGVGLYSGAAALVLVLCAWGLRETFRVPTAHLGTDTVAGTYSTTCSGAA